MKDAFRAGWIDDEKFWTKMMRDRNLTSHTYREATATGIAERIPAYAEAMKMLEIKLTGLFRD